jgi:hypothetical protein
MTKDWRLEHLETQPALCGVTFVRKTYRAYREGWTHDHCAACWATLAEIAAPEGGDAFHEGYATTADYVHGEDYEWVCPVCFEAFAEELGWVDATPVPARD